MNQYQRLGNIDSTVGAGTKIDLALNRKRYQETYEIFPAKVVTLKDPYRSGNIGINITGIHEKDVKARDVFFAPMLMPFGGGENYGFFAMPPIGSDVMVTFIDGDLKNPIILGAWQSRKKTSPAVGSPNEIEKTLAAGSKFRALTTGSLCDNAEKLQENYSNQALGKLSSVCNDGIAGFSKGSMETLIQGKIGEIPGQSDIGSNFGLSVDSVAGPALTTIIDTVASNVDVPWTSIFPVIAAGKSAQTIINSAIGNITSTLSSILAPMQSAVAGCPKLISDGLVSLKSDMISGNLGSAVQMACANAPTGLVNAAFSYIDKGVQNGLSTVTAMTGVSKAIDQVTKVNNLLTKVSGGSITEADAIKGFSNGSVDYLLGSSDDPGSTSEYVFGPQCPLPYRNQTPARTLEEVGQNLTENTAGQEELNSCYLSMDKASAVEDANFSPEPLNYIWKSPIGSAIEIDDTGYAEWPKGSVGGNGIDNRGVRLTTKKGAIVHLVDEKDSECILIRDKNNNYIWIDTTKNCMHIVVHDSMTETIHNDKTTTTGKTMREVVGADKIEHIGKDSKETIKGNKNIDAKKNMVTNIGGTYSLTVKGSVTIYTDKNVNIAAAQNVVIGGALKTTVEAGVELLLKAPIINFESM